MAGQSRACRCRAADDRSHRRRSAGQLPRCQFRSAGAALGDRAVRRSAAQRTIGGLFRLLYAPRRRAEGTERSPHRRQRKGGMTMTQALRFTTLSRILHWTMAGVVLAQLFIGIGMVASLSDYHWLLSIHRPLGI